jgi:hypothetical protein
MRLLLVISLIAVSPAVGATTYTPLVDLGQVDPGCRQQAEIPQSARIAGPSYDAAISTAGCVVIARTRHLTLTPTPQSVRALDDALAPAIAILDRVIQTGDSEHVLLARYAKADILSGNAVRLLTSVPKLSPTMTAMAVSEHDKQVGKAVQLVEPWKRGAVVERNEIALIVRDHPELANRNQVLAYMVAVTRAPQAARVISRR